jgi:hypothetical protein
MVRNERIRMRYFVLLAMFLTAATAHADSSYRTRTVTVYRSAQDDANEMARTGILRHRGGQGYEGIGFSTVSGDAACRASCYWGQRRVKEVAVSRGSRGWFACVRYW